MSLLVLLYYGDSPMGVFEKIALSVLIGMTAVFAILCVCCVFNVNKSYDCPCACVTQCNLNLRKHPICVMQSYASIEDLKQSKASECRVILEPGTKIDSEMVEALEKLGTVTVVEKTSCVKVFK